jgi:hypothetical protein
MSAPAGGTLQSLVGALLATAYSISVPIAVGRQRRIRFWGRAIIAGGSSVATVTVKLVHRHADGVVTSGYLDLPSNLDDAQGAAQPKAPTREVEHAFSVTAGATTEFSFYLDDATGIDDLACAMKANVAGGTGESVTLYWSAD